MRKRKKWLLVIAVALAIGFGYMAYTLVIHGGVDYLTVSELKSQAESLNSKLVRVEGRVVPGSINWDDKAKSVSFAITDDTEQLTVVHQGVVPANFKPGADLIVEGKYRSDDVLEALSFGSRRSLCNSCH